MSRSTNHKSSRSHNHRSGRSRSKKVANRKVYWKSLVFYGQWALLGLLITLLYNDSLFLSEKSINDMNWLQSSIFAVFKYFLNFPLGIVANWYSNSHLATTYLFLAPDSLLVTALLLRIYPHQRRIDRLFNYLIIIMFILMLVFICYSLIPILR